MRDVVAELAALGTREISLIGGEAYPAPRLARHHPRGGRRRHQMRAADRRPGADPRQDRGRGRRRPASAGVSVDGIEAVHDRLRGVPGSFRQALTRSREFARAGIKPGCNTQINALSAPVLEEIVRRDLRRRRADLADPAHRPRRQRRRADRPASSSPGRFPRRYDTLARLFEKGRRGRLPHVLGQQYRLFRPLRASLADDDRRAGLLGRLRRRRDRHGDRGGRHGQGLPVAAQGRHMAAATSATRRSPRSGRRCRQSVRPNVERPAWGFCGGCYYRSVCKSGCTWTADAILGRAGNNPMCDHRARTLRAAGMRERFEQTAPAPGEPFDVAKWRLALETLDGAPLPETRLSRLAAAQRSATATILLCRALPPLFVRGR